MTKKYGIRITLPPGDFLAGSHLLGPDWEGYRWFATAEERDHMYESMLSQPPYYRRGDIPLQRLERVERDDESSPPRTVEEAHAPTTQ